MLGTQLYIDRELFDSKSAEDMAGRCGEAGRTSMTLDGLPKEAGHGVDDGAEALRGGKAVLPEAVNLRLEGSTVSCSCSAFKSHGRPSQVRPSCLGGP
jgi:hypothetical protein